MWDYARRSIEVVDGGHGTPVRSGIAGTRTRGPRDRPGLRCEASLQRVWRPLKGQAIYGAAEASQSFNSCARRLSKPGAEYGGRLMLGQ